MKLVATFHGPTSVSRSVKCNFSDDEDVEYLVVAKTSILEVFAVLADSLSLQCTLDVWSRISSLNVLDSEDTPRQHILVTTDHPDPRLFTFRLVTEGDSRRLECISSLSLHERGARPAEFYNDCLVDQRNNVAVISSYVGKLKTVEFDNGKCEGDFDPSIRELNVFSMCFLQTNSTRTLTLAILHQDHARQLVLTSHELSIADRDLSSTASSMLADVVIPEPDANLIIPVTPHGRNSWNSTGGVLVATGSRILFYAVDRKQKKGNSKSRSARDTKPIVAEVAWPYAEVTAWCNVGSDGTRYLLGDGFGRLTLLAFNQDSPRLELLFLGEMSPPTCLTILSSEYVFVGSHFGDSQLIRIVPDKSSVTGSFLEIVDSFRNIAPIMDAIVVDPEGSGENKIVTCSGGKSAGSLRVIQNGANFDIRASLDGLPNITDIFSLKTTYGEEFHSYLLASTAARSHLLSLSDSRENASTVVRATNFHLQFDAPTLACTNMITRRKVDGRSTYENGSYVVQVTPDAVILLDMLLGTTASRWIPKSSQKIVVADTSPSQVCLALSNGEVVILTVLGNELSEYKRKGMIGPNGEGLEASALSFSPPDPGQYLSKSIIIGFWSTREVKTFSLPSLDLNKEMSVAFPHLPKSVLLHDFGSDASQPRMHLLVGLVDGTLCSFVTNDGKLNEKKVQSLGDSPVSLVRCRVDGLSTVLATSTRTSLFFWKTDTLCHSPVLIKDISASTALNTSTFRSSLILASHDGLLIGRVLEFDKLHMRTVSLGLDVPLMISYHPLLKAFGIGCLRTEIKDPLQLGRISSSFKVLDAASLSLSYDYPFQENEELTSLCTVELDIQGIRKSYFAVGTMFYDDVEKEPSRGRIFLFDIDRPRDAGRVGYLAAEAETKGCAYAIGSVDGKLVAAINTGLVLFGLSDSPKAHSAIELKESLAWNHNYLVTSLVVRDGRIIIGDAVNSIAVLELVESKFRLIARDYGPLWPLSLEASDKTSIIGANSDNNLFALKLQSRDGKDILEREGNFYMGETVNKFVPGCLSSSENSVLHPQQLYFTSTGRIGVILNVDEALSLKLSELQRNIAGCIKGPGGVDRTSWRAPMTSRGRSDAQPASFGFLDGDFLECFLDYPASSQTIARILAGSNDAEKLNMSYMEVRTVLESIRSMH